MIAHIYLLLGDEEYLKDAKIRDLKDTYVEKKSQSLNYNMYNCGATDINDAIQTAKTQPFLNPKRIVVLKDIQNLNDTEQKLICAYLENPPACTIFILTADKNENAAFLTSRFPKSIRVLNFKKLNTLQLSNWIEKSFQIRKKKPDKDVIDALIETTGNDLATLENCVEKVCLYAGSKYKIGRSDVEAVVGPNTNASVFSLIDSIIQKDPKKTIALADSLIKFGRRPHSVINVIFRQFEKLFLAKQFLLDEKLSRQAVTARLGINKFFVEKFFNQADSFTPKQLQDKFRWILWADLKAKTTGVDADTILEVLVTKLCLGDERVDLYAQA